MPAEASAIALTVGPGLSLVDPPRGASAKPSTTPSERRGTAEQTQSRMNDAELIREAQRGNHAAFEELVRQYDGAVLRLLADEMAVVDTGSGEETVSVALVTANVGDAILVHAREAIAVVGR